MAFFLIGAPRCGTTSLAKALAQHPQICFSEPKETHFFSRLPEDVNVGRLEQDYIGAFFRADQMSRQALGEGSVSYLYSPAAIRTIDRIFPDARFLVMVRNPLEMIPSYHARMLFTMDEDVRNFERAWQLQGSRAKGRRIPRRCRDPRMLQYAELGRLGNHLANTLDLVGRDRIKTVVFDDFASSPLAVYREVLEFLGLVDDKRTEIARTSGTKTYRSALIQRLLMRPPTLAKHIASPAAVGPYNTTLAGRLLKQLRKKNVIRTAWLPISSATRQELVSCFRDDVVLLGNLLNRNLRHWLDEPSPSAADERGTVREPESV